LRQNHIGWQLHHGITGDVKVGLENYRGNGRPGKGKKITGRDGAFATPQKNQDIAREGVKHWKD